MSEPTEEVGIELDDAVAPGAAGSSSAMPTYDFDAAFQSKIAALCVRDTLFTQRTDGLIKPEFFTNTSEGLAVDIAQRYVKRYKKTPGDLTTVGTFIKDLIASRVYRAEDAKSALSSCRALWQVDVSDRDFVVEQVSTFARHRAVFNAIEESVNLLDTRNFDKISALVRSAINVGANHDAGAYDYWQMIKDRTTERLDRAAGKLPPTGITTGYPDLDKYLYHKGWGRRELAVLMGGAKAGKTTALIDFGLGASVAGFNVLYITLEVAANIIASRMDANLSSNKIGELDKFIHDTKAKVDAKATKAGEFKLHEFPSGSMTVADLRRLIERYKSGGTKDGKPIIFDLVVIDYADLMAPERFTDNAIENSKNVYVNLRGIAMEEGFAILTATQTNRTGATAMVAKMEHVAEDFNKIRIADIVISINKTDEERTMNQARLYFAACRNQRAGFTLRIQQDSERMKFITDFLGEE
jgi:replicative DNA helicase